jgi:iron complex outermembrane recepter protein
MQQSIRFKKTALAQLIAAASVCMLQGAAVTAYAADVDEVVVTGVRAAQERAIDVKRNATEVVDAISAEDIGKLPDASISDSLQRVTGIQIERQGGQGSLVSIRGTQEVLTTLNGELFLTPDNILNSKADYKSVPSSLISGTNVYKSLSAKTLEGGIGGSVDLLTKRSLDLDDGFTSAVRVQNGIGTLTREMDPEISGLFGYKLNDNWATYVGYSWSKQTLADQTANTEAGQNSATEKDFCNCDYNGNGVIGGSGNPVVADGNAVWMHQGTNAVEGYKQNRDRDRFGVNYNLNGKVFENFEVNLNLFYNRMKDHSYGHYMQIGEGLGSGSLITTNGPGLTGLTPTGKLGSALNKQNVPAYYATGWNAGVNGGLRAGNFSGDYDTSASNNSLEFKYDAGGDLTASARVISARAKREGDNLTLANRAESRFDNLGGRVVDHLGNRALVNPGSIATPYPMQLRAQSDGVSWYFDPAFVAAMKEKTAWYINSGWLEGDRNDANLEAVRLDASYALQDEGFTSIDFGVRHGEREGKNDAFHYFTRSGVTAIDPTTNKTYDLLIKFHEPTYIQRRYAENNPATTVRKYRALVNGSQFPLNFDNFNPPVLEDPRLQPYIHYFTDLGASIKDFNASIPVIDSSKITNNKDFMTFLYGEQIRKQRPEQSYQVTDVRDSGYINTNFEFPLAGEMRLSGTVGVRVIDQTIEVSRNITDGASLGDDVAAGSDANHSYYKDLGDEFISVDHRYTLPSFNLTFDLNDSIKLRGSFDRRISLQELNQFGQGASKSYKSQATGEPFQRINSVNNGGNPYLNPWEADVYNLAAEWYPSDGTAVSLTAFYMDIGGFVESRTVKDATLVDTDGMVRDGANVSSLVNGKNASVRGLELAYQQSFTQLPSIWANTGITWNATYSPNTKKGQKFIADASEVPFNNTAETQTNLVLWYDDEAFEARIALNYLAEKYDGQAPGRFNLNATADEAAAGWVGGLDRWNAPTFYVDLGATYHMTEDFDLTLQVNNLTEEGSRKYIHWDDFNSNYAAYERRLTLGASAKF